MILQGDVRLHCRAAVYLPLLTVGIANPDADIFAGMSPADRATLRASMIDIILSKADLARQVLKHHEMIHYVSS